MLDDALLTSVPPDITGLDMDFEFDFQLECCTGRTYVHGQISSISYAGSDEDGCGDLCTIAGCGGSGCIN